MKYAEIDNCYVRRLEAGSRVSEIAKRLSFPFSARMESPQVVCTGGEEIPEWPFSEVVEQGWDQQVFNEETFSCRTATSGVPT